MSGLVKATEEKGFRARADRRIFSGRVIHVDAVSKTMILDAAKFDADGTPVHLENVPYDPHSPYQINDIVTIHYFNVSPHSLGIGMGILGGAGGGVVAGPYVTSLAKSGGAPLQGVVTLTALPPLILTEVGQNIEVSGGGPGPAHEVGSILMSLDGATFQEVMPIADPTNGWLVNSEGYLLVLPV